MDYLESGCIFSIMKKSLYDSFYKSILEHLINERERKGVSQTELAQRVGSTQSVISKIERAERRLDIAEFIQICDALNISAADTVKLFQIPKEKLSK